MMRLSLFIEIEKLVRVILPKHMVKADSTNSVKEVTKVSDDEVQFKWTLLSIASDSEEEAQELTRNCATMGKDSLSLHLGWASNKAN